MFEIDPDIRKAVTLDKSFYTDPRSFESSKEKIFARTWQFIGKAQDFTLTPTTILPGFLDEPVLVTRTGESLGCVSNVCTHRGKILVDEARSADLIRCGYHGRRFTLDGKFLSMPEFEGVCGFPSERDDLTKIPIASIANFLFVSLDPRMPFTRVVGGDDFGFEGFGYRAETLTPTETRSYEIAAHWALYCENYLEGFHIPFVHAGLNQVVDYGTYTTENFRYGSLQTGFDGDGNVAAKYLFLFPNTMFNFYPWGISVNVVRPLTAERSVIEFLTYVADERLRNEGAGADLHTVELEDEAVVESVQKGIRSRFYSHGRYSPSREQGTHHFHRLIAEFMNAQ